MNQLQMNVKVKSAYGNSDVIAAILTKTENNLKIFCGEFWKEFSTFFIVSDCWRSISQGPTENTV